MAVSPTPNRLLVVDDDADTRDALRTLLELEGYHVDTAENGQAGLQRLQLDSSACVILLDLSMPVMDGVQFRLEQLADPHLAHIPVVVCSGIPPEGGKVGQLKAVAYLRKPIEIDVLLSTIRALAEPQRL